MNRNNQVSYAVNKQQLEAILSGTWEVETHLQKFRDKNLIVGDLKKASRFGMLLHAYRNDVMDDYDVFRKVVKIDSEFPGLGI